MWDVAMKDNRKDYRKKHFRPADYLAGKILTGIAVLTITLLFLIFFFVFREATPLITGSTAGKPHNTSFQPVSGQTFDGVDRNRAGQEIYGITPYDSVLIRELALAESGTERFDESGSLGSLRGTEWMPVSDNPRYGLLPLLAGTIKITLIALLFAAPLAIMAAIFSASFAPYWLRELIKPAVELLAGFPSVVTGFFALMVMATFLQKMFGYELRLNAFVGGIAMALAAIPVIFTITEDALSTIPASYTEASYALGASRWQTVVFVTLPAAAPGIYAAILLGIGRVFGETMIALLATGNAAMLSANPFESVRTLAATIGAEMAEVVYGDTHYSVLFLIGALLLTFTFALNALAEFYIRGRLMKRLQGMRT